MNKTLSSLILAAFATVAFNATAASHAGGAPMKGDKPAMAASAASAPAAKDAKPAAKPDMKKEAKKEEAKK